MDKCQDEFVFIVGEERISVDKQKLARKIKYFETLFSGNYLDSSLNQYQSNLDWTSRSIKMLSHYELELLSKLHLTLPIPGRVSADLVEWICDEGEDLKPQSKFIKKSLTKFNKEAADQLIDLLDIANYFLIDDLQNDLQMVILRCTLAPQNAISFYIYAKNQPFMKDVQHTAFALCIEQFTSLPIEQLSTLQNDTFFEIMGNANLQCQDVEYLRNVMETWYKVNCKNLDILEEDFAKIVEATVKEKRNLEDIQCCVYHKFDETNKKVVVLVWDGTDLTDFCLELPFKWNPNETLIGAQIVSRGFDLYLIGGKFGLGNGPFNTEIWRFSLLTKQWYYVTSLQDPLRHMSAIFWKSQLYVIGGIGRFRIKNNTMRYYDLETEEWSAQIPLIDNLIQDLCTCIIDDKIIIAGPPFYRFDPATMKWERVLFNEDLEKSAVQGLKSISSFEKYLFCAVQQHDGCTKMFAVETENGKVHSTKFDTEISTITSCGFEVVGFHSSCNRVKVIGCHFIEYEGGDYFLKHVDHILRENPPLGCFSIKNPRDLYQRVENLSTLYKRFHQNVNYSENSGES